MFSSTWAWISTPGIAADRRGLDIVETDRRGADQHQLARDPLRRHPAVQDIDRRDIDRGIEGRVVHPELAVGVGRNRKALARRAWMPALSALIRMVPALDAMRSISKVSEGTVMACATMIIGTRRTMPSRSGLMVNRPRPAAAFQHRDVPQQSGKLDT